MPLCSRGHEHQVARRPGVERAAGEHARHAHARHLVDVVPADHVPFVGEDRIEPRVVRAVADGVVVEERARLVQVVQHLRLPVQVGVQHVLRQLERQAHRVAVVVVPDVVARVDRARGRVVRVLLAPLVDVDDAVAAVGFDDRRDERDDVLADVADVRAVVDGQAVGQLHQRRRRAGFGRVNRAGDVVDRRRAPARSRSATASSILIVRGSASFARSALFWSSFAISASDATATAIISRPSSVVPIV